MFDVVGFTEIRDFSVDKLGTSVGMKNERIVAKTLGFNFDAPDEDLGDLIFPFTGRAAQNLE